MGMEAGVCLVTGVLDTLQRTVVVQTHTGSCQRSRGYALLVLSLNLQQCYWGAANHCRAAQSPLLVKEGEGGCWPLLCAPSLPSLRTPICPSGSLTPADPSEEESGANTLTAVGTSGDLRQCVARVTGRSAAARAEILGSDGPGSKLALPLSSCGDLGPVNKLRRRMLPTLWDFAKLGLDAGVPSGLSRSVRSLFLSGKWGKLRPPDKTQGRVWSSQLSIPLTCNSISFL